MRKITIWIALCSDDTLLNKCVFVLFKCKMMCLVGLLCIPYFFLVSLIFCSLMCLQILIVGICEELIS